MNKMKVLKLLLWVFVAIIVIAALYMAYRDISKNIPKDKKTERFEEHKVKVYLFYAVWCPHCEKYLDSNVFMTTYDDLKKKTKFERVVFEQIDADKHKDLVEKYNVSGFPTILAVSASGSLINEFNGDRYNKKDLEDFVAECIGKA